MVNWVAFTLLHLAKFVRVVHVADRTATIDYAADTQLHDFSCMVVKKMTGVSVYLNM